MAKNNTQVDHGSKKRFKDEQTDKRNYEHLTDEDDKISEQDISNIKTDASITGGDAVIVKPVSKDNLPEEGPLDYEDEKIKDNSDPGINTAWNILGS